MKQIKVFFLYSDPETKYERFIEHLINSTKFCISCGELCDDCRLEYKSHAGDISGLHMLPDDLPSFIEEPEEFLPETMPPTDIVIAINVHQDILMGLPDLLRANNIPGLIVPIEDGDWVPLGLENQLREDLDEAGIQYAFPRPYCSLEFNNSTPLINDFIKYFKIGKPVIEINVKNGKISDGKVKISTPCGCAFYLNRELARYKPPIDGALKEVISKAHHSYPCNASMSKDIVLGDAPLHIAGYIHREIVYKAIAEFNKSEKFDIIDGEMGDLRKKIYVELPKL
jgi:hypothetical protein